MKEFLPFGHFWASNYGGGGAGSPGIYEQATLYMDFTSDAARISGVWSSVASKLTTTRASVAQDDTRDGWWGQFAANTPRLSDKGLLVEESRTNSIRNNTMVGAVAGTPGTLPTNWFIDTSIDAGMSSQIVGAGNELGIDYIDVRIFGTPVTGTDGVYLYFDNATTIVAANGQKWAISAFASLRAGSLAGVSLEASGGTAGGAFVENGPSVDLSGLTSTLTRYSAAATFANAATVRISPYLYVVNNAGVAVDFTIRLGWPQCELGAAATSPIKTTSAAVTRAADKVALTTVTGLVPNGSPITLFAQVAPVVSFAPNPTAAVLWGWTRLQSFTDVQYINIAAASHLYEPANVLAGTSNFGPASALGAAATDRAKVAQAVNTNDAQFACNGSLGAADAVVTIAVGPAGFITFGSAPWNAAGSAFLNGYIERVALWQSRLDNAVLQAMTAP